MTIAELKNELNAIEDDSLDVEIYIYGRLSGILDIDRLTHEDEESTVYIHANSRGSK